MSHCIGTSSWWSTTSPSSTTSPTSSAACTATLLQCRHIAAWTPASPHTRGTQDAATRRYLVTMCHSSSPRLLRAAERQHCRLSWPVQPCGTGCHLVHPRGLSLGIPPISPYLPISAHISCTLAYSREASPTPPGAEPTPLSPTLTRHPRRLSPTLHAPPPPGIPGAYGVVTMPFGVREGINIFLGGFIPTENLRFRDDALTFKVRGEEGRGGERGGEWRRVAESGGEEGRVGAKITTPGTGTSGPGCGVGCAISPHAARRGREGGK